MPDYRPLGTVASQPVQTISGTHQASERDANSEISDRQPAHLSAVPPLEQQPAEPRPDAAAMWLAAAARASQRPAPRSVTTNFVAAHGGAGSTTWARILGGHDAGRVAPMGEDQRIVLVTRASAVGIDAAKNFLAAQAAQVAYVLVVPAAPGRMPKVLANELRVLEGAAPLVQVPWLAELITRRPATVVATDVPAKDLARIRAALPTNEGEAQ